MIAVSSSLLVPSKPARESPNAAVLKWYNHISNHLHPITCLCSRLEATQVHLWVLLPTLKGKWFILESKMVGAVLKLVSSLPPYPPPPGIYTWILKRGNNFHMPLQRASQTECAVVTVCQATHDLQEWSLTLNKFAVSEMPVRSYPSGRWKQEKENHFVRLLLTPLLLVGQSFTKSPLCAECGGCTGLRYRRSMPGACSLQPVFLSWMLVLLNWKVCQFSNLKNVFRQLNHLFLSINLWGT